MNSPKSSRTSFKNGCFSLKQLVEKYFHYLFNPGKLHLLQLCPFLKTLTNVNVISLFIHSYVFCKWCICLSTASRWHLWAPATWVLRLCNCGFLSLALITFFYCWQKSWMWKKSLNSLWLLSVHALPLVSCKGAVLLVQSGARWRFSPRVCVHACICVCMHMDAGVCVCMHACICVCACVQAQW